MAKKGYDRLGNPLPCRPVAEDELPNLLYLPGFEPPAEEHVPASANRAELSDAIRKVRLRKEKPRPVAYRFNAEVRKGDRVRVALGPTEVEDGVVLDKGVETEGGDGQPLYVIDVFVIALDRGDEVRITEIRQMERIEVEIDGQD